MAHPSFSRLSRSRLSALWLSTLACGAASAQPTPQPAASAAATTAATAAPSRHMIAEIQVVPRPSGTADDRYKHVDAAIAVIQACGLRYEVHGMGTVVEGPPEKIWPLLQAVHQATLEAGAERTLSIIKVSSGAGTGGPSVDELVRKFRR
ncbi:thiamine-binding protein [Caldimonas sp. KR1-144]|uniref:thiamine-binding protein n=1 Tax=Caldimonas sp. KR1-144 TaxID=3400911 RepID=UPI003C0CAD35